MTEYDLRSMEVDRLIKIHDYLDSPKASETEKMLEDFAMDHVGDPIAEPAKDALNHVRDVEYREAREKIADVLRSLDETEHPQLIQIDLRSTE